MNIILNHFDFEIINNLKINKYVKWVAIILICQIVPIIFIDLNTMIEQKVIIIISYALFEFLYFLITLKVIKYFYNSGRVIKSMFYQSIFLNLGVIFTMLFSPLFIVAVIRYIHLYKYYFSLVFLIFLLSFIYICNISPNKVIETSKRHYFVKKDENNISICFVSDTLPKIFQKIPIISYIPYIAAIGFCLYAFVNRKNEESLYYLILSCMTLSAISLYSEFCYLLLGIKYLINRKIR